MEISLPVPTFRTSPICLGVDRGQELRVHRVAHVREVAGLATVAVDQEGSPVIAAAKNLLTPPQ